MTNVVTYIEGPGVEFNWRVVHLNPFNRNPPRTSLPGIDEEYLGLRLGPYRCRASLVYSDGSEFSVETTMRVSWLDTDPGASNHGIHLATAPLLDAPEGFDRLVLTEFTPDDPADEK